MLKTVPLAVSLGIASAALAEPSPLATQAIRDLIGGGAIVEIDTPLGTKLPVRYHEDGRLNGHALDLASYLGAATDTGRWWVASDQLCHKWSRWFEGEAQCLRLKKDGQTIHWRNQEGKTGTASIARRFPKTEVASATPAVVAEPPPVKPKRADTQQPTAYAGLAPEPAATPAAPRKVASIPVTVATIATPSAARAEPPAEQTAAKPAAPTPQAAKPAPLAVPPSAPIAETAKATLPSLTPSVRPPTQAAAAARPAFRVTNVAPRDVLNVRSGPDADFDVVGTLPPNGRGIRMTGDCRSMWCPVASDSLSGWVNRTFLVSEDDALRPQSNGAPLMRPGLERTAARADSRDAPRSCLTREARALLETIEARFGPVELVSTCRAGATIAGSGRPSRHASGNAIDFNAGSRKGAIVDWLVANHQAGGTMTYPGMDHIHVDIGPHFVSLAGDRHARRWMSAQRDWQDTRMGLSARSD